MHRKENIELYLATVTEKLSVIPYNKEKCFLHYIKLFDQYIRDSKKIIFFLKYFT